MKIKNLKRNPKLIYLLDDKIVIERSNKHKEILDNNLENFNKVKEDLIIQYEKYIKKLEKSLMFKEYNSKLSKSLALRIFYGITLAWGANSFPQSRTIYYLCELFNTILAIWDIKDAYSKIEEYKNALIDGYGSIEEEYKNYKYEDFLIDKKMFTPIEINERLQIELKKTK